MDEAKAKALAARVGADVAGAFTMALGYVGDRLGLFKALSEGPANSSELADRLSLQERYVREWLKAMAASEYVEFDGERYFMTAEQTALFADDDGPLSLGGSLQFTVPSIAHVPRIIEAFRDGGGVPFAELGPEIAQAIDRMHRPAFLHSLVQEWLPGVPGLIERLTAGIRVLDVGCGLGRSTRAIAAAFPASRVTALDPDRYSLEQAREICAGLDNVEYAATTLSGLDAGPVFDFVLAYDCIHDMPDPPAELGAIRRLLAADGLFVWVEPTGSEDPRENRNTIGRTRASLSPLHCLTVSLACGGAGLGTIIGESGARRLAEQAGFPRFDRLPIDNPLQQFFLLTN